ncbi:hypothetical protein MNBD_GAMMA04-1165, partial [hydrothermal vent metagenome]
KKYRWKQLSGIAVAIENKRASTLKFTAPTVTEKTDLVFELKAKFDDPVHDQITITVFPILTINGVRLPPEPLPEENNATLVGIDSNDNGVRDDVERAIYTTYPTKIRQQVLMQTARADQQMLADPDGVENAVKWDRIMTNNTIACDSYLFRTFGLSFDLPSTRFLTDAIYNTKDRVERYLRYNHALGGGVYGAEEEEIVESACEFNVPDAMGVVQ